MGMGMGWGPVVCELVKKTWHSVDYPYSKLLATLLKASIKG